MGGGGGGGGGSVTTFRSLPLVLLFLCSLVSRTVRSEIQDFYIVLNATEEYIHYGDGYLRGPNASIDLRDLTFAATGEAAAAAPTGSALDDDGGSDDRRRELSPRKTGKRHRRRSRGRQRRRPQRRSRHNQPVISEDGGEDAGPVLGRNLDGGVDIEKQDVTRVDIVSFLQPGSCAGSRLGCDWTELGVGGKKDDPGGGDVPILRWCCTGDAADLGMCDGNPDGDQYGRLIVSPDKFRGVRHWIDVPRTGSMTKKLKDDFFLFNETGRYVVVFANCDATGRQVTVSGKAVWKSSHGYLPGELYGFLYFYLVLLALYALLFLWYYCLMRANVQSRIPIEKWILLTIVMGLVEMVFLVSDDLDWNRDGNHNEFLRYAGILMGVAKDGFSRCLLVMVSLGWGVIRDTLGSDLPRIVVLGIVYIACESVLEFTLEFAEEDIQSLSYEAEVDLFDLATIFDFVVAAVNVIFIMWTLDALGATMTYLDNMNQTRKLARYLRLRTILLFAVLFAVVWSVFALVDTYDEDGIVREEHEWIVEAATEVNYLAVLVGVAILWRPNPNAKEYAYVMELSATAGADGGTELELTDVVPSAMDDDDDDEPTNYSNRNHDSRFKIDERELS